MPLQRGGGLWVTGVGVANLDGCNVFSNEPYVRPPDAPSLSLLQRPAGTLRVLAFCMQVGGGLFVNNGGVANLDGCNVYSNKAWVSARLTPLPGPFLQRPAGTFRVLAFCMQGSGGGLHVDPYGTATLTNTNVYENVASVRLHFEPS